MPMMEEATTQDGSSSKSPKSSFLIRLLIAFNQPGTICIKYNGSIKSQSVAKLNIG